MYELVSLGGHALPVYLPLGGPPRLTLKADTLWLRADGAFEEHLAREVHGPAPLVIVGQFSLIGSTIQLTQTGGTPVMGSFLGSRLTLGNSPADASVYHRRCSGVSC